MASNLRLRYVLDLVSNIGARANADAQVMQKAQAQMQAAITGTSSKFDNWNKVVHLGGQSAGVLAGAITGAVSKFDALDRVVARVGSNTSLERQTGYMHRLAAAADQAQNRIQRMRQAMASGLEKAPQAFAELTAAGYGAKAMTAPPIRAYSSLESAQTELKIAMTDAAGKVSKDFAKISTEAQNLGNQLPGTTKDFMLAARALSTQGVPTSVVAGGGLRASAYLGVLLNQNQEQSAEIVAKLREAHGLKDNELVPMADLVQRGFYGFGIKPQDYLETAKYAAPTYNTMGITGLASAKETLAIQGMAANVGLEGSSFGTNYSMMLSRLAEIDHRMNKKSQEAKDVKAMLDGYGIDMSFYDAKGVFKGNENMLKQLAKLRSLNPLQLQQATTRIFGAEAGRPAQILVQKGLEGYNDARHVIDNQADLDSRISMKMETFASRLEALGGTIENVLAKIGTQAGEGLKPVMDSTNNVLGGPVGNFFDAHPAAGTAALGVGGAAGAYFGSSAIASLLTAIGLRGAAASATAGAATAAGSAGAGGGLMAAAVPLATVGAGLFAGYQSFKLLDAVGQLVGINQREGVTLTPQAQARLQRPGTPFPLQVPQMDFLSLTAPGAASQSLGAGKTTEIKVGDGRMVIDLRVSDDRAPSALFTVQQQPSLIKINPGATNPGSLP